MLPYILVVIYLICVLGVAWLGRNTIAGAFGTGVFALLLTPAVALIALLICAPLGDADHHPSARGAMTA